MPIQDVRRALRALDEAADLSVVSAQGSRN
jgi:hypothetical protein